MHPVDSYADAGLKSEEGALLMTKRWVNRFCQRIRLSMRRGTAKFSEAQPEEVARHREIMVLRLLYVMVNFRISPGLVFQFDETGIELLSFGKQGRAPTGVLKPIHVAGPGR